MLKFTCSERRNGNSRHVRRVAAGEGEGGGGEEKVSSSCLFINVLFVICSMRVKNMQFPIFRTMRIHLSVTGYKYVLGHPSIRRIINKVRAFRLTINYTGRYTNNYAGQ